MRDMVAIDDIVVPIALSLLQSGILESKCAFPGARLGRVLGEWELTTIVVPRSQQVDRLAIGGSAEREIELDSRHFGCGLIRLE